jgi:hypothetical protein
MKLVWVFQMQLPDKFYFFLLPVSRRFLESQLEAHSPTKKNPSKQFSVGHHDHISFLFVFKKKICSIFILFWPIVENVNNFYLIFSHYGPKLCILSEKIEKVEGCSVKNKIQKLRLISLY